MSTAIHTCLRCAIPVEDDKLALSSCIDPDCPLNDLRAEKRRERLARPEKSNLEGIWNAG